MASTRHLAHEFAEGADASIAHAASKDNVVGLALNTGSQFSLKTLTVDGLNVSQSPPFSVDGEVICLALANIASSMVLIASVWRSGGPVLALYPVEKLQQGLSAPVEVTPISCKRYCRIRDDKLQLTRRKALREDTPGPDPEAGKLLKIEAVTSIATVQEQTDSTSLFLGTRSGDVFIMVVHPGDLSNANITMHHDKCGTFSAQVLNFSNDGEAPALFVCCDSELTVLRDFKQNSEPLFETKLRVLPTKSSDAAMATPPIDSVARLPQNLTSRSSCVPVVMVSGTVIYIAELELQPKPVLRHFKLGRKPVKVLHSQRLNALLTVVCDEFDGDRHSLLFIDADTGEDLSLPLDSNMDESDYISGLGDEDVSVRSIANWRYQRSGKEWEYTVLATASGNTGRLLVINSEVVDAEESGTSESHQSTSRRIRFWTKWRSSQYGAPIHSIATDPHGVFFCTGTEVHYEIIDMVDKKLKTSKVHELSSAAQWMEVVDGKLHVVTSKHSLEVLDYKSIPEDDTMIRLYSDDRAKLGSHCIETGDTNQAIDVQNITLLSDICCGLWGMWQPPQGARNLQTIFLAELPMTIRRFARCRSRPQWQQYTRTMQYGRIRNSGDDADIIGLGIDGSMQHFTLLRMEAWRLLRFIHNLALQSPIICPFFCEETEGEGADEDDEWLSPEPRSDSLKERQVDGDILQRCYEKRALEELMADPGHYYRFRELLTALDAGWYVKNFSKSTSSRLYFELGYAVLRYYLAPVF